jgi:hypothetical protein
MDDHAAGNPASAVDNGRAAAAKCVAATLLMSKDEEGT